MVLSVFHLGKYLAGFAGIRLISIPHLYSLPRFGLPVTTGATVFHPVNNRPVSGCAIEVGGSANRHEEVVHEISLRFFNILLFAIRKFALALKDGAQSERIQGALSMYVNPPATSQRNRIWG